MENASPKKVVVVGRDAPLWLAANALHAALSAKGVTVEVVELPALVTAQDVYATQPALEALHTQLGIDESQLLEITGGAFTLGQRFGDGGAEDAGGFFHPYGSVGAPIGNRPFIHHWLKARRFGLSVAFDDFSLTAAAAKAGRMTVPDAETQALARTDYGYHLPAPAYVGFLKGLAFRRGILMHQTVRVEVRLRGEEGIQSLGLDDDRQVEGDLFVDATGPDALLIGKALGVERESWRELFPCDRVMRVTGTGFEKVPIFAQVRPHAAGWIGFYPTQRATGLVNAYSAAEQSDDGAFAAIAAAHRPASGTAAVVRSDPGRRHRAWAGNCIAIGGAACAFDPAHNVDLQAVQIALVYLLALFPVATDHAVERGEYNRLTETGFRRIADFQAAWYALNRHGASRLWTAARAAPRSPELAHKIATFLARGEVPLLEQESFPIDSWQSLCLGCGVMPQTYSPQVDAIPAQAMKDGFRAILAQVKRAVDKQTSHQSYLEIFCQ